MREDFEGEFYPVHTEFGEWLYWTQVPYTRPHSYQKILVPLDGSIKEVDGVLSVVQNLLDAEGEAILLHVIPPSVTKMVGAGFMSGSKVEKRERARAMGYLKYFADRQNEVSGRWRCEVAVSNSVADGIVDYAVQEKADLIAMYTHDRKGLAKLVKGSIAEKVSECAPTVVRVVYPRELVTR